MGNPLARDADQPKQLQPETSSSAAAVAPTSAGASSLKGSYRAVRGLNYPDPTLKAGDSYREVRVEAGELAAGLPPSAITWLVEQGHIEPADAAPKEE